MVERLKDPAARARIRKDMTTVGKDSAGEDWDNEWQEIPGPEAILVAVVQNPELCRSRASDCRRLRRCGTKMRSTRSAIC